MYFSFWMKRKQKIVRDYKITFLTTRHTILSYQNFSSEKSLFLFFHPPSNYSTPDCLNTIIIQKIYISNYFCFAFFLFSFLHQRGRKVVEWVYFSNNQSVGTIYNQRKINILPRTTVSPRVKKKRVWHAKCLLYLKTYK